MKRRPPRLTPAETLFPYTTLFRSRKYQWITDSNKCLYRVIYCSCFSKEASTSNEKIKEDDGEKVSNRIESEEAKKNNESSGMDEERTSNNKEHKNSIENGDQPQKRNTISPSDVQPEIYNPKEEKRTIKHQQQKQPQQVPDSVYKYDLQGQPGSIIPRFQNRLPDNNGEVEQKNGVQPSVVPMVINNIGGGVPYNHERNLQESNVYGNEINEDNKESNISPINNKNSVIPYSIPRRDFKNYQQNSNAGPPGRGAEDESVFKKYSDVVV